MSGAVERWQGLLTSAAVFLGEHAQYLDQHAQLLEAKKRQPGWHGAQLEKVRVDAFTARNRASWCKETALGLKELVGSSDLQLLVQEPGDDVERRLREVLDLVDELGRQVQQQRRTRASLRRVGAADASEPKAAATAATS